MLPAHCKTGLVVAVVAFAAASMSSPSVAQGAKRTECAKIGICYCVSTELKPVIDQLFPQGTPTWYPQFSSAVNTAINGVAKGQITVDQAMQNIADATQKAMAQ